MLEVFKIIEDYNGKYTKIILNFTIEKVDNFLKQHPNKSFYAFAYDCNAEYGEVNLCFNTEEDFAVTLRCYQLSEYADNYQTTEQIKDLKYNTGDWEYQCFDTVYCATEDELSLVFGDDIERQTSEIMTICWETLTTFKETDVFKNISKTSDFIAYCIDHDEEPIDVLTKLGL